MHYYCKACAYYYGYGDGPSAVEVAAHSIGQCAAIQRVSRTVEPTS